MSQYKPINTPNVGNGDFSNNFSNSEYNPYIPYNEPRQSEFYNKNARLNTEEINKNRFQQNNYTNNFSENANRQFSVEQEESIQYEKRNNYLTICSKDRDLVQYPKSSNFVIDLQKEYRNITSIELITAIIPDKNNVQSEPFLLLNIKELDVLNDSNNKQISDSFAMLQLTPPTVANTFIQIDKRTFENTTLNFHTPKSRLSRMSISITDLDGTVFDFGGDGTSDKANQCFLVFKITTLDTDRKLLNQRNVY
jgi:hypothetical protein